MFWRIDGDPRIAGCPTAKPGDQVQDVLTGSFYVRTGAGPADFMPASQAFYTGTVPPHAHGTGDVVGLDVVFADVASKLAQVKSDLALVVAKLAKLPPGLFKHE